MYQGQHVAKVDAPLVHCVAMEYADGQIPGDMYTSPSLSDTSEGKQSAV